VFDLDRLVLSIDEGERSSFTLDRRGLAYKDVAVEL